MKKIFLLGSERSGSNLLRTLLGNHTEISAPIAPHFCDVFINRFSYYLPLNDSSRFKLLSDIELYVNHVFNDWNIVFDKDRIMNEYQLNTFLDFVNAVYCEKAKSEGKIAYFSKDNHNQRYIAGMLKSIPDAKFIYLFRDPRDQVASWLRTPIHLHTPYKAALKWLSDQRDCLQLIDFFGLNVHCVKYEDLVDNTEVTITDLLKFVELEIQSTCFTTNPVNPEAEKHILWKNINKPIIKRNYGKYKDILVNSDIELIESLCKMEMGRLGYALETGAKWRTGNPFVFRIREKLRELKSRRSNKHIVEKEMKILREKRDFIKSIFTNEKGS